MSKGHTKLRGEFYKNTGTHWENSQGEPDIDYVLWLEAKIIASNKVVVKWVCEHEWVSLERSCKEVFQCKKCLVTD